MGKGAQVRGASPVKLPRREFLYLAAGAAALPAVSRIALAQAYPARPVRIVAAFAAGGPADIVGRLIGQWLSERLGQPFVIENRPGAGGNVGTEVVVRASPDGYMLLLVGSFNTINATLYDKLNFNFIRDITVIGIIRTPLVMLVHPSVPAKTVPEFVAYAKANPSKMSYSSAGVGSTIHVAGEMFKVMTGVDMTHVPYHGFGPALVDLLGGQVQVMFGPVAAGLDHIRAGKLRALAVTTTTPTELLPDIPSMADFVPGYEASQWYSAGLRKSTPVEIVDKLNKGINASIAEPEMKVRIDKLGATPTPGSPADFDNFITDETEKWAKVIKFANIKPE
jgi:tripartite-type tricarboxylate transporter receptor subunit TctC